MFLAQFSKNSKFPHGSAMDPVLTPRELSSTFEFKVEDLSNENILNVKVRHFHLFYSDGYFVTKAFRPRFRLSDK